MKIDEVSSRLKSNGITFPHYTLRRKIDTYISHPTRNHYNNRRDITSEEYNKLLLALAIEKKTNFYAKEVKDYLTGQKSKTELLGYIVNSGKIDMLIKEWIEK